MSAAGTGEGQAVVPSVMLDELINVTNKLWEWLRLGDQPTVHADLIAFLAKKGL